MLAWLLSQGEDFFMYFVEHFIGTCLQRQLAFYMWIG